MQLSVTQGPGKGRQFALDPGQVYIVGRSPVRCHCAVGFDPLVSRVHCLLEPGPDRCRVTDLDSKHGTFLGNRRIHTHIASPGDELRIGNTLFTLIAPSAPGRLTAPSNLPPRSKGDHVGRYRLLSKIATGGMAEVWTADCGPDTETIAIKLIRQEMRGNHQIEQRFQREIRISLSIEHPNIVRFYDLGVQDWDLYIAMELIHGCNAEQLTSYWPDQRVPPSEVIKIGSQVLLALEHAHACGIIHRDIKPGNIMIVGGRCMESVKLTDFGLALHLREKGITTLTQPGTTWCSLPFVAPEQLKDSHNVDARADLFGVGATLYHLLTDHYVYSGLGPKTPAAAVISSPIVPIRHRAITLPAGLADVIDCSIQSEPDRRFRSAREMRQALEACI